MCDQISTSCQYSFYPISWGRHWYPSILITQKCFLKLLACLACHGWYRELKFSSHRHRYVDLCVTKFQPLANTPSIPCLLWCPHVAALSPPCRRLVARMTPSWNGIEGVLARGWNLVTYKSTYLWWCDENFSSLYQLWQARQANNFKKHFWVFGIEGYQWSPRDALMKWGRRSIGKRLKFGHT